MMRISLLVSRMSLFLNCAVSENIFKADQHLFIFAKIFLLVVDIALDTLDKTKHALQVAQAKFALEQLLPHNFARPF